MENLLSMLIEAFQTLLLVAFFCGFPLLTIGSIIYSAAVNLTRNRLSHQKLAQAFQLPQLNPADHILKTWYGGFHRDRAMAITTFGSTYRYYSGDRSRVGVRFTLRIVMEVRVTESPGLLVARKSHKGIPQNFEEAFDQQNAQFLSPAAREAMLAFVYKGYPTGIKKDLSMRFTRGTRILTFCPRTGAEKFPAEVLPNASMILIHDHLEAGLSPEKFHALLDEMSAVAQALEMGVVPPLLAGQAIPPTEGWGHYLS